LGLRPHDLPLWSHHQGQAKAVVATGEKHLNGVEDVAFITIYFRVHKSLRISTSIALTGKDSDYRYRGQKKCGLE